MIWEVSGHTDAAASRNCSKHHVKFLCSSNLFLFNPYVSLVCTWSIHTVVPIRSQLERNTDLYKIENLSIANQTFPMHMLTLLSVDEISLPRYMRLILLV